MLVNSSFYMRQNSSQNYPQFGHAPSACCDSPILGRKSLNSTVFNGLRIINLPGAPSYYLCGGAHISLTGPGHDRRLMILELPTLHIRRFENFLNCEL